MKKKENIVLYLLILCIGGSLFIGRYSLSVNQVIDAFIHPFSNSMASTILYQIRFPRICFVLICGGFLAITGSILQTIFKNPLVSADVLGVSSGCSLGAILGILCGFSPLMIQCMSFVLGLIALYMTLSMVSSLKGNRTLHLILCGMIVSALANALIMGCKLIADPIHELPTIEFWLMGGFSSITWKDIFITTPLMAVAMIFLYKLRYTIFLLSLGDEEAQTLGVDVKKVRLITLCLTTLIISNIVSCVGIVSWISLMAPHIAYLISKKSIHERLKLVFITGSLLLLVADNISRCLFTMELPISIVTSFMGALVLWYFLKKRKIHL